MSATTIASYGRNGQKDVCFRSWIHAQILAASDLARDGGVWKVAGTAQYLILQPAS